jgi:hypothetical protein
MDSITRMEHAQKAGHGRARRWLPGLDDLFALAAGNLLVQFNCAAGPMFLPVLVDRPQKGRADDEPAPGCLAYERTCV